MEIDFVSRDFGPHIDYFQRLPLDFRLGSVHFVPTQDGVWLDCDGRFERFAGYLRDGFREICDMWWKSISSRCSQCSSSAA